MPRSALAPMWTPHLNRSAELTQWSLYISYYSEWGMIADNSWPGQLLYEQPVRTVIRFLWVCAKFGTCTVVSVNGTLVEDKMRRLKGECAHFSFNKCPIYTHDGASAKLSTNSHETDTSAVDHFKASPSTWLSIRYTKSFLIHFSNI